jgi:hypothetical protein
MTFAISLRAILSVLAIASVVVVVVVEGAVSCSRCKRQYSRLPFFGENTCSETRGGGFVLTPGSPNECECTEVEFLVPYTCRLRDSDSCSCEWHYPDRCPAGKCDYSFQCGTTLYVCWNLISPVILGVCLEDDDNCENNDGMSLLVNGETIESIEYCYDGRDNNLQDVAINCGQLCALDPNVLDTSPDQIIGNERCPNGEMVQRYTKSCAPDGANGFGDFENCPQEESGLSFNSYCEMPFCDYGVTGPFHSTVFVSSTTTVLDDPIVLDC